MLIMFGGVLSNLVWFAILIGPTIALCHLYNLSFNPFESLRESFIAIGRNMVFLGSGDIFGQMGTIAASGY
jgi:hypothetical protein